MNITKTWIAFFIAVLSASLLLNMYFAISLSPSSARHSSDASAAKDKQDSPESATSPSPHDKYTGNTVPPKDLNSAAFKDAQFPTTGDISAIKTQLDKGNYGGVKAQLLQWLKQAPDNEALLLLEAELQVRTAPLADALIHFHDLLELPLSAEAKSNIEKRITSLYHNAHQELTNSHNWDLVAALHEPLFQRIPESREYILHLSEAYARQRKITLMEDVLASLAFDDSDARAIREIAQKLEANANASESTPDTQGEAGNSLLEGEVTKVPLLREGDQYRVEVRALNQQAQMIVDTGANTTAITTALFKRLGGLSRLSFIGNFDVNTASGSINAPLVQIPAFYFAGYRFENISALVLPQAALPSADGLLGMNVLGQFDFSISPQDAQLTLRERAR